MAFGGFDSSVSGHRPMAEINMIPLIDVMLVLLVIFIITAPLLTHAVKLDLPKAASVPNVAKPDHIQLAIDAAGVLFGTASRSTAPGCARACRPPPGRRRSPRSTCAPTRRRSIGRSPR